MARVVQQRTSPPYLLIIMVFLFLIAATLAVLGYMSSDKRGKDLKIVNRQLKKLAGTSDLRNPKIQKMMNRYDTPPPGERAKTVVKQLESQVDQLSKYITGKDTDGKRAIDVAGEVLKKIKGNRGLAPEALALHAQVTNANRQIKEKDDLLAERQRELANRDQHTESMVNGFQKRIGALQEQVLSLDKGLTNTDTSYKASLKDAKREWARQRSELDKEIAVRNQDNMELRTRNSELLSLVEKLKSQIRKATQTKTPGVEVGRQPDGKILKVLSEDNLCYIDLGSSDRVSPGLTFTVYPPTGIPEDGAGKGTVVITSVAESTSECRIKDQQRDDPIVAGDLVANLAFDPTRTYTFAVEGNFDLYGTGKPTTEGAAQAKALIIRFGGRITDQIDLNTDFVVLGAKPAAPPKPSETARAHDWHIYQQQLAITNRYNEVKHLAESMQIPILNTNRFLAYIGYAPIRSGS